MYAQWMRNLKWGELLGNMIGIMVKKAYSILEMDITFWRISVGQVKSLEKMDRQHLE